MGKRSASGLLAIAVALAGLVSGCARVTSGSAVAGGTAVTTVSPFDSGGRIDGRWTVTSEPEWNLTCGQASSSAVGPNVQECGPGAAGAAVCWTQPGHREVYCGTSPWETSLRKLWSIEEIGAVTAPVDPQPWGVELTDGNRCTRLTSGAWPGGPGNTLPAYRCETGDLFLLAGAGQPINRSGPVWTAVIGQIGSNPAGLPAPVTAPIRSAIFAG